MSRATVESGPTQTAQPILSNAEIADRLASLAQLLSTQKENPYKIKAYTRAAAKIRTLSESIDDLVHDDADLTAYAGIGEAIASAIREIVITGTLGKLEKLRSTTSPELASISAFPRLDPKRVFRIYKKLNIRTVEELREKLENGEIEKHLGLRVAQHVRQGVNETHAMLLYRAHDLRSAVEEFLLEKCGVSRAEAVGDYRRRVDVIEELVFVVETDDFATVASQMERYGGRTPLLSATWDTASYALSSGIILRIYKASEENWGLALITCTGSKAHLRKLAAVTGSLAALRSQGPFPSEEGLYAKFGLSFIEPELREGYEEIKQAAEGTLPVLVTVRDIHRGPKSRLRIYRYNGPFPKPENRARRIGRRPLAADPLHRQVERPPQWHTSPEICRGGHPRRRITRLSR
jgi:DNA polymerase (family 10)